MKKPLRFWLAVAIGVSVLLWVAILFWHLAGLAGVYQQLHKYRSSPVILLQNAPSLVHQSRTHIEGLYWSLLPVLPVMDGLSVIPEWGDTLSQIEPLLLYGVAMSRGVDESFQVIAPSLSSIQTQDVNLTLFVNLINSLQGNDVSLRQAEKWFTEAGKIRKEIHPEFFPEKLKNIWMEYEPLFSLLEKGTSMLPVLPSFLGTDQPRRFLVLAQNHEELRATGGFISGIGILEVHQGKILNFDIGDSYAVDNPEVVYPQPPDPMAYYMKAGYWMPRDANWSPDFPTSAKKALDLYTLSTGDHLDGVVAFDQVFIYHLLEVIGPVQLPGSQELVDARNVMQWMVEAWAPDNGKADEVWWGKRKSFMGLLAKAIRQKLTDIQDLSALMKVSQVVLKEMQSGHLMMYFEDPDAQRSLHSAGLDAGIYPGQGDFLMLVDTNMGFNKADSLIERALIYTVDLTKPDNPIATLIVRYQNTAPPGILCQHHAEYGDTYESLRQRCYWNFWRVLAPAGSQLLSAQVPAISGEQLLTGEPYSGEVAIRNGDGGTTEFSGMLLVPTASKQEISLTWQLPSSVLQSSNMEKRYSLRIQKQPGLMALPVMIGVRVPDSFQVAPSEEGWRKIEGKNEWIWQQKIEQTVELNLSFR